MYKDLGFLKSKPLNENDFKFLKSFRICLSYSFFKAKKNSKQKNSRSKDIDKYCII